MSSAWALVREIRARAGLSQRALAERSGIAQSEIARIERGRQQPSLARLEQLAGSAGYDLRIELAPRDEHDTRLIRDMLELSIEERLAGLEEQAGLFAAAREVRHARRR